MFARFARFPISVRHTHPFEQNVLLKHRANMYDLEFPLIHMRPVETTKFSIGDVTMRDGLQGVQQMTSEV